MLNPLMCRDVFLNAVAIISTCAIITIDSIVFAANVFAASMNFLTSTMVNAWI